MILILASLFLSHVYIYIFLHSIRHVFWHSILHSFWHSISLTYVIWNSFWHSFGIYSGILWHGFGSRWAPSTAPLLKSSDPHLPGQVGRIWKNTLSKWSAPTAIVSNIYSEIPKRHPDLSHWHLFILLRYILTYILTFHLTFCMTSILTFFVILTYIPTFYLAYSDIVSDIYNLLGICPTMSDQSLEFYPTRT